MKERNYGLDVVRLLAMFGILLAHVLMQNQLRTRMPIDSAGYWIVEFIYILIVCPVDIFGIMAGYFGIKKSKNSTFRAIELSAIVLFYSVLITIGFLIFLPSAYGGGRAVLNSIFPFLVGRYWFVTCFIPILILQPFINKMLLALTKRQHAVLAILGVLIFGAACTILNVDLFQANTGFSFVWLLCCYVLGAYIGRADIGKFKHAKLYCAIGFFTTAIVLFAINFGCTKIFNAKFDYLITCNSPLILFMGLCAFFFFMNLNVKHGHRPLKYLSSVAFDVYIIHGHAMIYDWFLPMSAEWLNNCQVYLMPLVLIGGSLILFAACLVIGALRNELFKLIRINKLIEKISGWIDPKLYKEENVKETKDEEQKDEGQVG